MAHRVDQARAADAGDYHVAIDDARDVAAALQTAAEHGGSTEPAIVEAEADIAALDQAGWHQAIAADYTDAAGAAAADGDLVAAEAYADLADDASADAADYGGEADTDGIDGDPGTLTDG
mgnify:CR=1 FL=1